MRIRMRAHWTYAYPNARPLDVCVSECAPIGHMRIRMRRYVPALFAAVRGRLVAADVDQEIKVIDG